MAKIIDYRDVSLDDLVIGKGQVRVQDPGKGIEDLAISIDKQGLLQPILICEAREPGKWEILTGQRRFLAHKRLNREAIAAAVLDERVDEAQAKAISITENLIRRQLTGRELKDGILYLYKIYGSVTDVVEATGISRTKVCDYVKYPRLTAVLKRMVDDNEIDINAATKAQDAAADDDGVADPEVAVKLAWTMNRMTNVQRKKLAEKRKANRDRPIDDVIEEAKTGAKVIQILATVTQDTHRAIQDVAREEGTNQDEAVATLIEEALAGRGTTRGLGGSRVRGFRWTRERHRGPSMGGRLRRREYDPTRRVVGKRRRSGRDDSAPPRMALT